MKRAVDDTSVINIIDVFTSPGKKKEVSQLLPLKQFTLSGEVYPLVNEPQATFTFSNIGTNKVLVEGKAAISLAIPCSRCLKTVEVSVEVTFAHEVMSPEPVSDEPEDIYAFMNGSELRICDLIIHELIPQMPTKVLCREDCLGICPECGQNLNEGECGCDRFVPDPRMAAIKDIFNASKEV